MNIDRILQEDIVKISDLTPEKWDNIGPIIEQYTKFDFCHPIKLTENNGIHGIGTVIFYENTCWIAHLIVRESFRNKGIGTRILKNLLEYSENKGYKTVLLFATEMGLPLYKKWGFEIQTEYVHYKRSKDIEYKSNPNIRFFQKMDLKMVIELDKIATGENREKILSQFNNDSYVYDNGKINGYFINNLGEGSIVAETWEAGMELIKLRNSKRSRATIPIDNLIGNNYFKENGFEEIMKIKKMIKGNRIECKNENIYNRIGGNFG